MNAKPEIKNSMRHSGLPLVVLIVLAFAASPHFSCITPARAESLEEINKSLAASKAEQAEIEKKAKSIERELNETRERLVETAQAVQGSEKTLHDLDRKIAALEKDEAQIRENLESGRADTARLLLALERLRRMPPEAMIVRPETPLKTAQSVLLMRKILPALDARAQELRDNLQKLESISSALKNEKEKALLESEKLKKQMTELDALAAQRKTLYEETDRDLKAQGEKVRKISAQAKNLADLVRRLEEEQRRKAAEEEKSRQASAFPKRQPAKEKMPGAGHPKLPVSGAVITRFGEPDDLGAPSQGIRMEGRAGSLVTAPMGGIVRFAGNFKNYGNMVILEHEKGWHSLVAGLEKIDTVVGRNVSAGEPLGALRQSPSSGGNPVLYYELRHNGKVVNPSEKFAGLI